MWIASVISGNCVGAHDNTATGAMSALTSSPWLISLVSTAASLPFFLFTIPAGVLADSSFGFVHNALYPIGPKVA
jgi:hypothetical protein